MRTERLLLIVAGLIFSLNLMAQKASDYQFINTDTYVRVTDLSQLQDGCSIILAARHDVDETSYYAMPNEASGKPQGVLFTSTIIEGLSSLPSEIVDNESDYVWILNIESGAYTFTNTDGDMIAYGSSGTDFVRNGVNSTWNIETAISGEGTIAPNHEAFVITNVGVTSRSFAFRKYNNDEIYEKFAPYSNSASNMNGSIYYFFIDIFVKTSEVLELVATPTFSPEGGSYHSTQYVDIECSTDGAVIYYTLDGSDPDDTSLIFSEPIEVSNSVNIKAIAMKEGMMNSAIAEASYIIAESVTVTFYDNGVMFDTYELVQGEEIGELPVIIPPDGFTFKGWTENVIDTYLDNAPAMLTSSSTVENDIELYAVFAIDYDVWRETDVAYLDSSDEVVIAISKENEYYAMSQTVGSSGQPIAEQIIVDNNLIVSDVPDVLKWNISNDIDNMIIYPNGMTDNWLYCTSGSNNNSLRIGDNVDNNMFELRTVEINEVIYPDYLYNISTMRFVGVYYDGDIALDWRAYKLTASGAFPTNIKNQSYHFYKYYGAKYYCTNIDIPDSQVVSEDLVWGNVSVSNPIIIESGATLTIEGAIASEDAENIIIKEGGQLIHNNAGLLATLEKEIGGYASMLNSEVSGWFTIASPMSSDIPLSDIQNLIPEDNDYDLYRYDEPSMIWQNVKEETNNFTTLEAGRGYLYANEYDATISFVGELNSEAQSYYLTKTDNISLSGFHLIGNPFSHKIYKGKNAAIDDENLSAGFYVITGEGAWQARIYEDPIMPGQAILIKTTEEDNIIVNKTNNSAIGESTAEKSDDKGLILISVTNKNYEDIVYLSFNEGHGLDKIPHQNEDIQMISVGVDGRDYAIATIDNDTLDIPLSFRAKTMGEYTINALSRDRKTDKLYLIDCFTGVTTNILTDDYSFIATSNDDPERFILSFNEITSIDNDYEKEYFAYTNNEELIIKGVEGDTEINVYDMLGRAIIGGVYVSDAQDVRIDMKPFISGVYIVRLTNANGVRTQKISLTK